MTASTATVLALGAMLLGGVGALVLDAFVSRRAAIVLAAASLFASAVAFAVPVHLKAQALWGVVRVGGVSSTVAAVIALLSALIVVGGWREFVTRDSGGSLSALVVFAAGSSVLVAQASELTLLLIALETAAACGYALVALGGSKGSREAALKYFIQGAIATGFFLVGMGVLVALFVPSGSIEKLTDALSGAPATSVALAGLVPLLAALAFKTGAAPFHSWAPDAYESAAPSSSAFLAAAPKVAAVTALASLASRAAVVGPVGNGIGGVLAALAILSVVLGSVTALRQRSYMRMLGYAGVAQVGYAIVAVLALHQPQLSVFFIVSYAIAGAGAFLSASAFRAIRPDWDGTVDGLAGMAVQAPALSFALSVLLISLAGIPPLLGFWSKFLVFAAAFGSSVAAIAEGNAGYGWLVAAAVVAGLAGSVVSLAYYGNVLRSLYAPGTPPQSLAEESLAEAGEDVAVERSTARSATLVVALLAVAVVVLGLLPVGVSLEALLRVFS
jgi:NADH-quinone oxidoreductase subunit N